MDNDKETEHESFGCINLSRVSGHATLFGSSVQHQSYIVRLIDCSTEHLQAILRTQQLGPYYVHIVNSILADRV